MTHLARLASLVFNRVHAIEPLQAEVMLRVLDGRIGNLDIRHASGSERMSRFEGERVYSREGRWRGYSLTGRGAAVVPIVGELVNRGAYIGADSGLVSYEGVRQQLKNAATDPSVRAIVLDIDSPGGMVAGCAETASLVREISRVKPVVACANSDTCSAAYAIASGANAIVATESSRVGSIGVLFVHADHSVALDKKGVAVTIFQGGKHKTDGHPFGPLSPEVAADIQASIDVAYQAFVNLVIKGRPQLTEQNVRDTEARVYRSADALSTGIADYVGTFEQAVALAESGQVPKRPQENRSSVPAPRNSPPQVAASKGVKRMEPLIARPQPESGWENMSLADLNAAVANLRQSFGSVAPEPTAQPVAAVASSAPATPVVAQQPAAPTESVDQAVARGRNEERARVKGILALGEAKERPEAAMALALETDIPVASAGPALAKFPVEAKQAVGGRAAEFYGAVAASGGMPKVSHMTPASDTPKASTLGASMDRMLAKQAAPKRMALPAAS